MEYVDYYKVLGVDRSAEQADIKKAYRKMARKYHPDVSKVSDAEARFKEVGEAYEVLKDKEKRAAYDQLGANWKQGQDFNAPPGWESQFDFGGGRGGAQGGAGAAGFSDFFESIFSGGGFTQQPGGGFQGGPGSFAQPGQNLEAAIGVTLYQAFHGEKVAVRVSDGRRLNVKIPAGVKDGQKIRLAGQGGEGSGGGKRGHLIIKISIKPDPDFKLNDKDIELTLPIAPWEAALGAEIKVPTLSGTVQLKIPANSSAGKRMRIKGRGMPGKPAGNFYVRLEISTQHADSDEEVSLYEKMRDTFKFEPLYNLNVSK
jgi:curved DNA-binding protein